LSVIDSSSPGVFFVDARYALATFQFRKHIIWTKTVPREHDQTVKPEIGRLANDVKFITVLRRKQGLGRLFADLLQDGIVTFCEQRGHIRIGRIGPFSGFDGLYEATKNVGIYHGFE
jgi:hypothetical protein